MKVFLISHRGGLGDFVMTWPTLAPLRWKHSEHHFLGLGKPDHMKLASELGLIDSWLDCESSDLLPFYSGDFLPKVLEDVDSALIWTEPHPKLRALLERKGKGRVHLQAPFPGQEGEHVMDYHRQCLPHFSLPGLGEDEPYFPISTQRQDYAIIHPGSGSTQKNYDPEFYAFLANELKAKRHPDTRILLGPAEKSLKRNYENRYTIEEPASAVELARLLGRASVFIGNDSGVSHLSAILGTKTLALYKSTDPAQWGVKGRSAQSLEAANEALAMTRIQKALS